MCEENVADKKLFAIFIEASFCARTLTGEGQKEISGNVPLWKPAARVT
jgi:hypothetical protein